MGSLVCVATYSSRPVAEAARCTLEAAGIKSTISAEDTGYDIVLAQGGARLMVNVNSVDAARQILSNRASNVGDSPTARPMRFSLRALFALTTLVAFSLAGYVINGSQGAVNFLYVPIFATIGVQVLLSCGRRRPFSRPFVAIAGLGFLAWALFHLLWGLFAPLRGCDVSDDD